MSDPTRAAMANPAGVLADPERRAALETAQDPAGVLQALGAGPTSDAVPRNASSSPCEATSWAPACS